MVLTSFYSPARRKTCGYLFLTPRRQNILSESLRLLPRHSATTAGGVENSINSGNRQPVELHPAGIPVGETEIGKCANDFPQG
jgi:hypothetical protein